MRWDKVREHTSVLMNWHAFSWNTRANTYLFPYRVLYTWLLQAEYEKDKAAKKASAIARCGRGGWEWSGNTAASHSALMTHAQLSTTPIGRLSGINTAMALIGCHRRPSIQTGLVANSGPGVWIRSVLRSRSVEFHFRLLHVYLSHLLPFCFTGMISASRVQYVLLCGKVS